jgi:type IV pilus assembly protein PilW
MTQKNNPSCQKGMSLIEVMISMTLSLFLLAGLVEIAVSNKTTYGFQQGQAMTNEDGRYALASLDKWVGKAGYRDEVAVDLGPSFPAAAQTSICQAFVEGQVVARNRSGDGICIRYRSGRTATNPADPELTCGGTVAPGNDVIVTSEIRHDTTLSRLVCDTSILAENIANFNVIYGVDSRSPAPDGEALRLSLYTDLPANWRQIVSMRFAVVTTSTGNESIGSQSYPFPLSSSTYVTAQAGDKRLFKSYEQTVPLRNVLP